MIDHYEEREGVITSNFSTSNTSLKPIRAESSMPTTFRYARYPGGELRIQGGYTWQEEQQIGLVWRDLPIVEVNSDGISGEE